MSAKEQYRFAQRVMRLYRAKHADLFHDMHLKYLAPIRVDILMKAWQTL